MPILDIINTTGPNVNNPQPPNPGKLVFYVEGQGNTSGFQVDSSGNLTTAGNIVAAGTITSGSGTDTFASLTVNPGPLTVTGQTNMVGGTTNSTELAVSVTGDTMARYAVDASGVMNWGNGTLATDTNLYRGAASLLQTDSSVQVNGNLAVSGTTTSTGTLAATNNATVGGTLGVTGATTATTITATGLVTSSKTTDAQAYTANYTATNTNNAAYNYTANASTGKLTGSTVTGDTQGRFVILADGTQQWGTGAAARDTTLSRTGVGVLTATGLTVTNVVTENGGTSTAGSAPAITPTFANGTAAQLTDTTRDYMVYLNIGTAGTGFTLAIGPTSGVANTVMPSATPLTDQLIALRLPAGWFLKWSGTTTTLANQLAIGC